MEPILKVEALTKTFSGQREIAAVNGISFELFPGECLAIIGESGSGKTTAVNMISRLTDVTAGSILLEGQEITHRKGKQLREVYRQMQMVFQTPTDSFDPRRTLGDGIGESLRNVGLTRKETQKRVEALLEKCGLPGEFANRYPHQVSGGQCQRAAIARALAIEPKLLICDEATSALDVTTQAQIVGEMARLRRDYGTAILLVTHNLGVAAYLSDRILVMRQGRIEEAGNRDTILQSSTNAYTRSLLESVPTLGGVRYV